MLDLVTNNKTARIELTRKSHKAFFGTYFGDYIKYPSADIHHRLFDLTQNDKIRFAVAMTFRGSAKSTICTMSYPIWAILGEQQKHFVLIVGKTIEQTKKFIDAIKREFETNTMLQNDFGAVSEETTPWNSTALTFQKYDAQIAGISVEQSMRGVRFKHYRPDVLILDDIEDTASVRMQESRDKLEDWFNSDLLGVGDIGTRVIMIANNLHEDSLPNRIIAKVKAGTFDAQVIKCPLIGKKGVCAWPGKFPDKASIAAFKRSFPSTKTWRQEYQLEIIPPDEQIIAKSDISYYEPDHRFSGVTMRAIGVDLARSMSPGGDRTSMIPAIVEGRGEDQRIYILPDVVNKQLEFDPSATACMEMIKKLGGIGNVEVFYESVGYQGVFGQHLKVRGVRRVTEYLPGRMDKRERLYGISGLIKTGKILFPKNCPKELIDQIVNFGSTKHDDLVDALTTLVLSVHGKNRAKMEIKMAVGDLYHIEEIELQQAWKDVEFERRALEMFPELQRVMNERFAPSGVRWEGPGQWKAVSTPPVKQLTRDEYRERARLRGIERSSTRKAKMLQSTTTQLVTS